jgi:hypothetical protein
MNSKIPIWVIIITILIFLFVLVFIANKAVVYDKSPDVKSVDRNFRNIAPLKYIKSEDALIFSLEKLDDQSLIFLAGDFDESSLTLWDSKKRVYNKILNSAYGLVFYKNKKLISQGFYNIPYIYEGKNVLKNIAIDVSSYTNDAFVSVNNYSKTKVYIYNPKKNTKSLLKEIEDVNIEIENSLENYDYSEFGVVNYIKSSSKYSSIKKIVPDRNKIYWFYDLKAYKKYLFVYHKSKYNLLIKYNDTIINNSPDSPEDLVMLEFNPNIDLQITVQNLDEKISEKDINSDFVDAIYAPYYAYEQFVYGKKQKVITAKNRINFKVCLFEL